MGKIKSLLISMEEIGVTGFHLLLFSFFNLTLSYLYEYMTTAADFCSVGKREYRESRFFS